MARTKKATEEVVEQTTEEVTETTINVDNPVDLEQEKVIGQQCVEGWEPETIVENVYYSADVKTEETSEEQAEPDKVSEVMDHELTETEQEENEEQNEPEQEEQEEQEEPKVGFEKWIASQVVNNPITWNRANYVPQVGANNHDQNQNVRVETARKGVRVARV